MNFDIREQKPAVSVCLITYNHAPYIKECLDSILTQETDFPFEICLGEDESTDGTREICIAYAEKHPDRIRLALRSQSTPNREAYEAQGNYNYVETLKMCRGKYIADADGDDAWIDTSKLRKQYELMESDSDLCLVHSDCAIRDESSEKTLTPHAQKDSGFSAKAREGAKEFMYDVLTSQYKIMTCTMFTRASAVMKVIHESPEVFRDFANGDLPLWCELTRYGTFGYTAEPLSVYRLLDESLTRSRKPERRLGFFNRNEDVKLYLARKHGLPTEGILINKIKIANRLATVTGDGAEINRLREDAPESFSRLELFFYRLSKFSTTRMLLAGGYRLYYKFR